MAAFPRQTQFCMKAGDWSREAANIFAILFIFEEEYCCLLNKHRHSCEVKSKDAALTTLLLFKCRPCYNNMLRIICTLKYSFNILPPLKSTVVSYSNENFSSK